MAGVLAGAVFACVAFGLALLTGCSPRPGERAASHHPPPASIAQSPANDDAAVPRGSTATGGTPSGATKPTTATATPTAPVAVAAPSATAPAAPVGATQPSAAGSGERGAAAATAQREHNADVTNPVLLRGLNIYAKHCALCHGQQGLGDGLAAYLLYPKPRDFSQGQFRLTSVTSGLPTDEDLLRTLRRGMPGSAMPSWAHLPEEDLKALVATVRHLAVQGKAAGMMARNKSMTPAKALKTAQAVLASGPPLDVPPEPPAGEIDPALGKATYLQSCAACHGEDGTGKNKGDLKDASGFPIYARDFTRGVFKGSPEALELARRITGGMPGSPMPASALPAKELWSMVHYIRTLIKPDAQERVAQRHLALTAGLISAGGAVPLTPDDAGWAKAQEVFVPLMPLWWRDQRVEGVNVRAVHDGRTLAVRLSWPDPTGNDLPTTPEAFTDGAALQLSSDADPPFFGMGGGVAGGGAAGGGVVNIWHWKASWQRDLRDASASLGSMKDTYPNVPSADTDAFGNVRGDTYFTARAAGNPLAQPARRSAVETLAARGMGTLTSAAAAAQAVKGNGRWKDGEWVVVFVRAVAPGHDGEVPLDGADGVNVAFAVWDGAAADRDGQKSVSIWHRLTLGR